MGEVMRHKDIPPIAYAFPRGLVPIWHSVERDNVNVIKCYALPTKQEVYTLPANRTPDSQAVCVEQIRTGHSSRMPPVGLDTVEALFLKRSHYLTVDD